MSKKAYPTTKDILLYHWKQAWQFPRLVLTSLIVGPITIVLERYVTPLIIAAVLLGIQNGTVTLSSSWWLIAIYAAIQICAQVIGYRITMYAMWGVQVKGARNIYQDVYSRLSSQSIDFYNNNFAGSLVSRVTKFASAFMTFWDMIVFQIMFVTTAIIATIIGTAFFMWQFSLILLVLVICFTLASYMGSRFMRPRQKARSKAYTKISAQLSDSISNMFAVKIDSREQYEQARLSESVDTMVEKEFHVRSGVVRMQTVYSSIIMTMRIGVLVASIWAVEQGVANTALVYLLLTYTFNLIEELRSITQTFRVLYQITGDSEEILEALNEPISIKDTSRSILVAKNGSIDIQNIVFQHTDSNKPLFDNLSLSIESGQKIGVVGVSGSGKTTLTKLLMRFIDPNRGAIKIDGHDISDVSIKSLHDAIAYVPQEPILFHRTIAENISYSKPRATHAEIINAAKQARIHDFIMDLPEQYKTYVGERGVKLSGGQRQRIAIARAILKDAPLLILDEATSALDSESEILIQQAIENLWDNKTSIVIAHRLSTIAKLDRIIVFDKGTIIEDGTHQELLSRNGTYAKLWGHQSGGFIEE